MSVPRDFSVMPVQVDGEPKPIERAVRASGQSFRAGGHCLVEFGATWATIQGRQVRVDGQWFKCEILGLDGATVRVRLMPDVRLSSPVKSDERPIPCRCDEGWMCEEHPDQPINYDGCDGAGLRCQSPRCPWWQGSKPAALNTDDGDINASSHEKARQKKKPH